LVSTTTSSRPSAPRSPPGTSATFALTSEGVPVKVAEAFHGTQAELLNTNRSGEQELS
jgi:uncharacterized membrane protein